jgi:hypothetical protein
MDEASSFIHPIHQDEMWSAERGNHPRRVVTAQLALRRHHPTSAAECHTGQRRLRSRRPGPSERSGGAALHRDGQGGSLLPPRLGGKHEWRSTSEQPLLERPSRSSRRSPGTPGGAPWSPAVSATSSSGTTLPSTVGSPRSSPPSSSLESTRSPACSPSSWFSAWPSWPVRPAPWSLPTTAIGWAVGGRWRPGSCS